MNVNYLGRYYFWQHVFFKKRMCINAVIFNLQNAAEKQNSQRENFKSNLGIRDSFGSIYFNNVCD